MSETKGKKQKKDNKDKDDKKKSSSNEKDDKKKSTEKDKRKSLSRSKSKKNKLEEKDKKKDKNTTSTSSETKDKKSKSSKKDKEEKLSKKDDGSGKKNKEEKSSKKDKEEKKNGKLHSSPSKGKKDGKSSKLDTNGKGQSKKKLVKEEKVDPVEDDVLVEKFTSNGDLVDDLCQPSGEKKVGKEDFDLMCVIGRGSFGKVMQVKHKRTNQVYAMKVMRKDAIIAKNQVTHTIDEKHILQKIKHPFIVNLNFAFQTKDKLYMIMDYINGGELFFHLKNEMKFSETRVKFYAAEISSALIHLHSHGIIYRDLKPENILLDIDGHIVITDFGLSKEIQDDSTDTFCGTPEYLAPEVLLGEGHSYPVDWWSLGTLVYEMLIGLPPFYSKSINVMYKRILDSPLRFPEGMSKDSIDLLEKLLERDPDQRLCGPAIREHPFFSEIDWELLEQRKIEAPWKPPVKDKIDTTCIDPHFKNQTPGESLVTGPAWLAELSEEDKDLFDGFTFAGQNALEGNDESE